MNKPNNLILQLLTERKTVQRKSLAVLIDPDKINADSFPHFIAQLNSHEVDFIFLGGSLITDYSFDEIINRIRAITAIPVILFPGNSLHVSPNADALLLLSLISGRNPDLLIGQHVVAAPILRKSKLEILPTGYMLIESGRLTTVTYISNTLPIPHNKPDVAVCTALAGEMLGLRLIYLDAGSGAQYPVSPKMIQAVTNAVSIPVIVGGGIDSHEKAHSALNAGADLIVVGNALERDPGLLKEIALCVKSFNSTEVKA